MSIDQHSESVSRRHFLRNVTITAVAATVTGAGAAAILGKDDKVTITTSTPTQVNPLPTLPPPPVVQNAQTAADLHMAAPDMLAQLAESQAENMRLQAALDATQRELEGLRTTSSNDQTATEELRLQLSQAAEQLGIMSGLVALYEQLDTVDVGDALQDGLTAVSSSIGDMLNHTPMLSESIAIGQQALAEVENHMPLLENGRIWLDGQMDKVAGFYSSVEFVLQNVLESVGSFLDMVENWFADIRKWLPFGISEKAAEVVDSLSTLVAEVPHTINGLQTNVAQPLDVWLTREADNLPRLHHTLIQPMRDNVLTNANEAITYAQRVQTTYQEQVALAMETAVANRNALRAQIDTYRQQNQV